MFDNKPLYEIAMISASSLAVLMIAFLLTAWVKPKQWKPDLRLWSSLIVLAPLLTFAVTYATLTVNTKTVSEATIYRNDMNAKVIIRYHQKDDDNDKPIYYTVSSDKPLDRPKDEAELELQHVPGNDNDTTVTITKNNTSTSRNIDYVNLHGVDSATEIKRITIVKEKRTVYFRGKPASSDTYQSAHVYLKDNSKEKDKLDKLFEPSKSRKE